MKHRRSALLSFGAAAASLALMAAPMAAPAMAAPPVAGDAKANSKTTAADTAAVAAARAAAASVVAPLVAGPAVVTLGFDDQRVSQAAVGPLLAAQGFHGVFYVISQDINDAAGTNSESLNMTQLKSLEAAGNEIGGHTRTHQDLTTLNAAAQTTEACGGRTDLIADGFKAPVSFAYPYGSFNSSAETVVKSCGFNNARSVSDGPDTLPPAVPMVTAAMPSVQVAGTDPAVTVAQMEGWVTGAESGNNKWVQVIWHDILAQRGSDEYYQTPTNFTAFLTWLKTEVTAGRVVVKTAGEAMAGTTTATAPGAPSGVAATAGNASATVRWTPPTNTGGSPITGYTVTSAPGGVTATVGGSATSATVSGLTNGTAYTFTVTATNVAGTSPPSAPSTAVTPTATATAPGAPSGVAATAGNASATVRWTPPADNGGSAITGYTVNAYVGANTTVFKHQTAAAGATSLVVTGLTNGTAYTFTVAATNAAGTGAFSARSVAVTPGTVPGAPVIGTAVAGTAGGPIEATAKWAPPAATGGSAITGYRVTALRMSGGTVLSSTVSTDQPAASRSLDMTLPVAGNYRFTVQAINAAGAGAASARSNRVAGR